MEIGYKLSSEEQRPNDLVKYARLAEDAGFGFAMISDHFHPWIDKQGQSPFVWSVIGALAHTTTRLQIVTGVTCPIIRIHPAILAQAAATSAAMLPGRFVFGVGAGENLNEHVVGARWPNNAVRLEMLVEAIEIMRDLWKGELSSHRGKYYEVDNAKIYTRPDAPPPIVIAAGGEKAAELAGRIGDGLVMTSAQPEQIKIFERAGGKGKPKYGELGVCWAQDEKQARRTAKEWWPTSTLASSLHWELPLPEHFEEASEDATEEEVAQEIVCGADPAKHVEKIREYAKAGFDHVCIHQVGPEQEGFIAFYEREVLPKLTRERAAA